ncbi:MAG: hypothetical protein DIU72_005000 [Pseudomonadota bacterium]
MKTPTYTLQGIGMDISALISPYSIDGHSYCSATGWGDDCIYSVTFPSMSQDVPAWTEELFWPLSHDPWPIHVFSATKNVVGLIPEGNWADVTHHFDTSFIDEMSYGLGMKFIEAEEHPAALRRAGLDRIAGLVPRSQGLAEKPVRIYEGDGTIHLGERPQRSEAGKFVGIFPGEEAVYSAMHDKIYLVGPDPVLRIYHLGADSLETITLDRVRGTKVAGLAFDTFGGEKLHTLLVHQDPEGDFATVFVNDLRDPARSRALWSVPWTGSKERTDLVVDTTDSLMIVASDLQGWQTSAWRFVTRGGSYMRYLGEKHFEGFLRVLHHGSRSAVISPAHGMFEMIQLNHRGFGTGPGLRSL